ncbi:MAG TPA: LuxR C-terminal-related transcriptional regulator [Streptosporangiaceae bacterium]|nr:LuxR C-terminal-related transcriptional regulator [Streptosporangiaceae bacterium]
MPELPDWAVTRPRIDKLIADGARGPLTSVTGPPGAGKTMAVAAWAASTSYPCTLAWISIDDYDNRPRVFWSYVVAALRRAGVAVPRVVPGPGRVTVDHAFLVRLAAVLAVQDPPVVLVLDDLHLLTEPVILEGLAYVLRNAGPGLHLMVVSRADPLLPLHRYRLAGQLAEIRAGDLAFSVREGGLLLAHHGVTLSVPALERVTARTEGWAAGMRLAALSLQGHSDPEQFAKELETGDSALTAYLIDEVLNVQAPAVRDMLLRTSILDNVSPDLAAELTGDRAGADALPALARADAFVRPLGQGWYRYHSLLAAVLRLKLRVECGAQVPDLYRRAARWCQRHGRLGDAVRYAAQSGDWRLAAGIVVDEFAVSQLIELRGHHPLAEAFRGLPRDEEWTQPQPLLVMAAIALCRGAHEAAAVPLTTAEDLLGRRAPGEQTAARLAAALIRLALARRTGDFEMAVTASRRAEDLMTGLPAEVLARHPEISAQVLAGCGVIEVWAGRLDAAAERFASAAASATRQTAYERADCLGYLALVEALRGRLSRAVERAGEAADAMSTDGDDLSEHVVPAANVALAWVCLLQGDTQEAHAQLKLAEAALRSCPDKLVSALACVVAAQRRLAGGQAAPATDMIRQAGRDWSPSPPGWLELMLIVLESRAQETAGDAPAAVATAQRAGQGPGAAAALAHAWLAAGDQQAARRALSPVGAESRQLEVALAEARLSYTAGDGIRGRRCLERALRLAKPEQVRLPFVLERAWLRQVLRRDPDLVQPYRELLGPSVITPGTAPPTMLPAAPAAPLVVERLSAREREVLTHASGMLSTAEIAAEMFLSVNTVKTHLRSIYRKLSATHRSEAVRRARQLELI